MSSTRIFFYGLFMDEQLLLARGIQPSNPTQVYLDGYRLRIGERATLVPDSACRVYGVMMALSNADIQTLYSDVSVAHYVASQVTVVLPAGERVQAVCYMLPPGEASGSNPEYARSLLRVAEQLGLPVEYRQQIASQMDQAG